jgi:hypothetical protein
MILRRAGLNPLCRQCGHEIDRPTTRCPMCGMRTGLVPPLQLPARKAIAEPIIVAESVDAEGFEDAGDVVLAPPLERAVEPMMLLEIERDDSDDVETSDEHAPIARNVSLGSLLLGTMLVAACLGLSRVSMPAGIVAFLILIPAYIRTLSATYYYRQRQRQLAYQDIAAIFSVSFVLSLMGLVAGGIVMGITGYGVVRIAGMVSGFDPTIVGRILSTAAGFVTIVVLIHKVWPVNED